MNSYDSRWSYTCWILDYKPFCSSRSNPNSTCSSSSCSTCSSSSCSTCSSSSCPNSYDSKWSYTCWTLDYKLPAVRGPIRIPRVRPLPVPRVRPLPVPRVRPLPVRTLMTPGSPVTPGISRSTVACTNLHSHSHVLGLNDWKLLQADWMHTHWQVFGSMILLLPQNWPALKHVKKELPPPCGNVLILPTDGNVLILIGAPNCAAYSNKNGIKLAFQHDRLNKGINIVCTQYCSPLVLSTVVEGAPLSLLVVIVKPAVLYVL